MNKPNILHIFVDQMRSDTIRALGNPVIQTPNLDALVEKGVAFTNAYSPSPVCIAARCSMIYGQYPMNTGCYENTVMPEDNRQSMMDVLTDSGYRTHGIGKCHFSPDLDALRGFQTREKQEELGVEELDKEPYYKHLKDNGYDYVCEPNGIRGEMYYIPQPSQLPERLHPTQWIGDRTIKFLNEEKDSDQPWYLFSSFIHPHPPFTPPNPWHKIYRSAMMPLPNVPEDVESLHTYVNKCQNRYKYRDQGIDNNLIRNIKAYYYACISFVDYQVGRIVKELEATGQMDNTMIVFTADHGEHLGDYNCFGKRSFHDSAAKIPMIAYMKDKFEGGKICDTPVNLVDLAPTFTNLAGGINQTHSYDGVDLYDIVTGQSDRSIVFGQHAYCDGCDIIADQENKPQKYEDNDELHRAAASTYMAVSKSFKYFYSAADEKEYLFDKTLDPKETRNKAGLIFHKQELEHMRNKTIEFLKDGGETTGIEKDNWKVLGKKDIPDDPDFGLLVQDENIPWVKTSVEGYSTHELERMF